MKQFFKFMFASMLGFILTLFLVTITLGGIVSIIASSTGDDKEATLDDGSIVHIKLDKAIKDRPSDNPLENYDFFTMEDNTPLTLSTIIENIDKAKNNDKVKGIYLDINNLRANLATTDEIRKALAEFKASGKFIVSYSENIGQNEYYLSSIADEIYLNPAGEMTMKGLGAELMFFKDALDRLEVEMQVIRHGKFKSAIEPFIRNDMSPENEEQYKKLIQGIWDYRLESISESRGIAVSELNAIADELRIRTAKDAVENKLVTDLKYEDEVLDLLKSKVGIDSEDEEIAFVSLKKLSKVKAKNLESDSTSGPSKSYKSKNKIAVIFAEGEIVSGNSKDGSMGSATIAKAIKEAREDDKVKAIVLRVNSPGGSALASDVMWRETILAKKEKPFIVSMGSVAASGGYYISCGADKIYAERSTITGSIGVFGLIPNMKGLFENKMGIHTDRVTTNTYSDGISAFRPMTQFERDAVQEMVEDIYDDFTSKVAEGRNMAQADVDSIGQGRVWSGIDALEIGLVDEIGGLEEAIAEALKMAKVKDYKIKTFPKREDPFEKMLKDLSTQAKISILGEEFGHAESYYRNIKTVLNSKGIYTRLPVDLIIE